MVRDMTRYGYASRSAAAYAGQDNGRDHVAEVTVLGTAITRFTRTPAHEGPRTLPILRLSRRTTEGVT